MSKAWKLAGDDNEVAVAELLDKNPKLIDKRDEHGSPLHYACQKGHVKIVSQLLVQRPKLADGINNEGCTPLQIAAGAGHERIVKRLLVERPRLFNTSNSVRWTPLHYAASRGHEGIVALLVASSTPDNDSYLRCEARGGWTALHVAVNAGHSNVVSRLLHYNPRLTDCVDVTGLTPLHCGVISGKEEVVELLLSLQPEQVNNLDSRGNTLLHHLASACGRSSQELVQKIWRMNRGALHMTNHRSYTPLHVAINNSNWLFVKLLLRYLSVDEIVSAFEVCANKSSSDTGHDMDGWGKLVTGLQVGRGINESETVKENGEGTNTNNSAVLPDWLRESLILECAPLLEGLHQDEGRIVLEYLGLPRDTNKPSSLKRKEM